MQEIGNAISTYGFPIVMCLIMCWYCYQQQKTFNEMLSHSNSEHKQEVEKLSSAIENNTIVMTKLLERLCEKND